MARSKAANTNVTEVTSMSYIVVNLSNAYDSINTLRFGSEAEAEAKAEEVLRGNPNSVLQTGKLLSTFSAQVTVSKAPAESTPTDPVE